MPPRDDSLRGYYAQLVARRRSYGGDPDPRLIALAEGRPVEPGEIEAWERRLGIDSIAIDIPSHSRWRKSPSILSGSGPPSPRSASPDSRSASGRPRWYLRSADETSARRRSRPSGSSRELPELHETGSGFAVALSPSTSKAIGEEVLAALWEFDNREIETGGYLYGFYLPDEDGVSVVFASGPGHNGKHASRQVQLSDPSEIEVPVDGLIWVGDWHSEPVQWDTDSLPSDPDLSMWARHSEEAGVLPYASLIVTPAPDLGWTCPRFNGWITREDEDGVLVCEPAKVSDG
jgi:hypothetical protein